MVVFTHSHIYTFPLLEIVGAKVRLYFGFCKPVGVYFVESFLHDMGVYLTMLRGSVRLR